MLMGTLTALVPRKSTSCAIITVTLSILRSRKNVSQRLEFFSSFILLFFLASETEVLHDSRGRMGFIQRIEVNPRHPFAKQFFALARSILNPELSSGLVVLSQFFKL